MNELVEKAIAKIDKSKVDFIYMIGSYSRNANNEFSDLDIIIALKERIDSYHDNQYLDGTYVSLNYDSFKEMQKNYLDPLKYIKGHIGIVDMVKLYDPDNQIKPFREKCMKIDYLNDFKKAIDDYVNQEVVDWIEAVNKACNGYFNSNTTKMLEGLHALTYGMLDVLAVSEGIIMGSNGFLESFKEYFGNNSTYKLVEKAFGIKEVNLMNRVVDGLMLYTDLIEIIKYRFTQKTSDNVDLGIKNILKVLNEVTK